MHQELFFSGSFILNWKLSDRTLILSRAIWRTILCLNFSATKFSRFVSALSCYSAFRLQKLRENLIVFFCKLSRMIFVLRDVKRHGSLDG
ncbi:MAG: hypothetical protein ACI9H8_002263, partial [Lysobacterales bacterium]